MKSGTRFNHTWDAQENALALRAVIFDYGMVLTAPPDPEAWAALKRITGLDEERLHELYWGFRHEYDEGKLTGLTFWHKVADEAGIGLSAEMFDELNDWDARMWTIESRPMLAWHERVRQRGLRTAILSNMGDNIHNRMIELFDWLPRFDVLVWSYVLGVTKPDPAIYRHVLKELDLLPEEVFFLDDRSPNIEAARALGMRCHQFTTVEKLRADLVAQGLDAQLPLPE
jgi:putative hydrolase of the HAD superfamily